MQPMDLLERLATLNPDSSKNTLRSWLEKGRVLVDGEVVKLPKYQVDPTQEITLGQKKQFVKDIEILFEDNHLVVIFKPAGLLSVETDFDKDTCAHTILKRRYHSQRVHPVHRLDRETSGVMVFAYSELARDGLKEQFHDHTIDREYCGIVDGKLEPTSGTWTSHLQEDATYFVKSAPDGKLAITHYTVTGYKKQTTHLIFRLETGRKNQIRVHCKESGHPISGDTKYGSTRGGRLCLHARKLSFTHPATKKRLSFESPVDFYSPV